MEKAVAIRKVSNQKDMEHAFLLCKKTSKKMYETVKGRWDEKQQKEYFYKGFCKKASHMIEVDGKVVGCYALSEENDHLYLQRMYIDPSAQDLGLGSKIMKHAIEKAVAKNKPLELEVLSSNKKAYEFYKKRGFFVVTPIKLGYRMRLANA